MADQRQAIIKKPAVIIGAAFVCLIAFGIYWASEPVPSIETKGPEETVAWVSLGTAFVSLLTSVVGLVMRLFDLRQKRS